MPLDTIISKFPLLLSDISHGSERIKSIVSELRNFSKKDLFDYNQAVDINATIHQACRLINNIINKATHHFELQLDDCMPKIPGNPQRLEQVFIGLIQNACQSLSDNNQKVTVATSCSSDKKNVIITIIDEGQGIDQDTLKKVKDPFFTTKRESGGTGLGLSISQSIIEKHQGILHLQSTQKKGTTITITLPA